MQAVQYPSGSRMDFLSANSWPMGLSIHLLSLVEVRSGSSSVAWLCEVCFALHVRDAEDFNLASLDYLETISRVCKHLVGALYSRMLTTKHPKQVSR